MHNSFKNDSTPSKRSAHATFAQSTPRAPIVTNNTGIPPAGTNITRRSDGRSSVGIIASSQNPVSIPGAEVDHGSDTASTTARPSASRAKCLRSNAINFNGRLFLSRNFNFGVRVLINLERGRLHIFLAQHHIQLAARDDRVACCSKKPEVRPAFGIPDAPSTLYLDLHYTSQYGEATKL